MYVFHNQYMESSSFSIVIKVLNIYCWYKKLYNVLLYACMQNVYSTPALLLARREKIYIYVYTCVCVCVYVCIYTHIWKLCQFII